MSSANYPTIRGAADHAATVRRAISKKFNDPAEASTILAHAALDALVAQAERPHALVLSDLYDERDAAVRERDDWHGLYMQTFAKLGDAERSAEHAREALRRIGEKQPETIAWLRANGVVFHNAPNGELSDWQNVAFWIYTALCETESIARAALTEDEGCEYHRPLFVKGCRDCAALTGDTT